MQLFRDNINNAWHLPKSVCVLLCTLFLTACAGELNYSKPGVQAPIVYDKTLKQSFNQAWASTLKALEQPGFSLIDADKASGVINVAVAGIPQEQVDCGLITSIVFSPRAQIERTYTFKGASAHEDYEQLMNGNVYDVSRDMQLDNTIQLQLQALGQRQTLARVNVLYQLSRHVQMASPSQKSYPAISDTINFSSNSTGRFPGFEKATSCVATGAQERAILDLLH